MTEGPHRTPNDLPSMKAIKGLLIDLDGVRYVGDRAVPGAREALRGYAPTSLAELPSELAG